MPGNTGTQDIAQIITMGTVSNPIPVTGQVWFDGSHIWMNIGGTSYRLDHPVSTAWTASNVVPVRTFNAAAQTITTLSQFVGTMIQDLQAGIILG